MAQTQNYEKIVILKSNSDSKVFPENSSTKFTNNIYPILVDEAYDAIYPMCASIPIISGPTPEKPPEKEHKYRFSQKGLRMLGNLKYEYFKKDITLKCESPGIVNSLYSNLELTVSSIFTPHFDLKKLTFEEKPDLKKLGDFHLTMKLRPFNKNNCNDDCLIGCPNEFPHICLLNFELNKHLYWRVIKGQQTLFDFIETNSDGCYYHIKLQLANTRLNPTLASYYGDFDYIKDRWNEAELQQANTALATGKTRYKNFNILYFQMNMYDFILPDDIFEETSNAMELGDIDDDDDQIYVHCNQISSTRIANQFEPIFLDTFVTENSKTIGRLNEYLSIPMFIPLDLTNSLNRTFEFEFLNAIGEINKNIDPNFTTFVLCKLIKKYYDFSDGKKKTHITNIFTA